MTFHRNFPLYPSKIRIPFYFGTVLGITVLPLVLLQIYAPEVFSLFVQSVSESLFGKAFLWLHVFLITTIILVIIILSVLPKHLRFLQDKMQYLQAQEKEAFFETFSIPRNIATKDSQQGKKVFYMAILMGSTFLPIITVILTRRILPAEGYGWLSILVAFFSIAIPFYWAAKKLMQLGTQQLRPLINHLNQHVPNTSIPLETPTLSYSYLSVRTNHKMAGKFRGHTFEIESTASGQGGQGGRTSIQYNIQAFVNTTTPLSVTPFTISEKSDTWKSISGASLEDCFLKRFTLTDISVEQLPDAFKRHCLSYDRSLYLDVTADKITFDGKNISIYPAYSLHGYILFIDFLIQCESLLSETNQ